MLTQTLYNNKEYGVNYKDIYVCVPEYTLYLKVKDDLLFASGKDIFLTYLKDKNVFKVQNNAFIIECINKGTQINKKELARLKKYLNLARVVKKNYRNPPN